MKNYWIERDKNKREGWEYTSPGFRIKHSDDGPAVFPWPIVKDKQPHPHNQRAFSVFDMIEAVCSESQLGDYGTRTNMTEQQVKVGKQLESIGCCLDRESICPTWRFPKGLVVSVASDGTLVEPCG